MTKTCPYCHCEFECRNDNILECDCVHVILSKEALNYISSRFADCLCVDCLREINQMPDLNRQHEESEPYEEAEQPDMEKTLISNNH